MWKPDSQEQASTLTPSLALSYPPDSPQGWAPEAGWLWPNVLGLDAPLVAVVWQRWLASRHGLHVGWPTTACLALVVWSVYLADHLADAYRSPCPLPQARHRYAAAHPRLLGALLLLASGTGLTLLGHLDARLLHHGLVLALLVASYLGLVHSASWLTGGGTGWKEATVGVSFALGAGLPLVASRTAGKVWLPELAGLALVCWLNCRLIDAWEGGRPMRPLEISCALGSILLLMGLQRDATSLCVAGSLALLLALHAHQARTTLPGSPLGLAERFTPPRSEPGAEPSTLKNEAYRVGADVVLLTPLLAWWC